MNRFIMRAGAVLLSMSFVLSAHAQASRTWVSGVGDDANPCSRTAPCKTFAGAISKTAAKGVISVLDPGGYGGLTITKSITIDGSAVSGSVLVSGTTGILVNAGASDIVRLRNISLEGTSTGTYGIRFIGGAVLFLDGVRIHDFTGAHGIYFAPSGSSRLVIGDSVISNNNSGGGIFVVPGASGFARVSIEGTKVVGNYFGIRADERSVVAIRNSQVSSNAHNGVLANSASQPVEVTIDNSQITNNGVDSSTSAGIRANGPYASVVISDNLISGNYAGIRYTAGADISSFGSNRVVGNTSDGTPSGTLPTR